MHFPPRAVLVVVLGASWLVGSGPARAGDVPEAKRLRILIAVDTHDRMGLAWGIDGANMKDVLEASLKKQRLEQRFTIDLFTGKQVTPENILAYYRKLDVQPNETLLFYYSGHGGFHRKRGHYMALTYGALYRADLIAAMKDHDPRLTVLLTDCCANYGAGALAAEPPNVHSFPEEASQPSQPKARRQEPPGKVLASKVTRKIEAPRPQLNLSFTFARAERAEPAVAAERKTDGNLQPTRAKAKKEEPPATVAGGATRTMTLQTGKGPLPLDAILTQTDGSVMRDLLFKGQGVVDINGCVKGGFSNGTPNWGGSVFTIAFMELQRDKNAKFDKNSNNITEWNEFFPFLRDGTRQAYQRLVTKGQVQTPEAWSLPGK